MTQAVEPMPYALVSIPFLSGRERSRRPSRQLKHNRSNVSIPFLSGRERSLGPMNRFACCK